MTKNILAIREVELSGNISQDALNIFKIINFGERYYFKLIFHTTTGNKITHLSNLRPSENIFKYEGILRQYNNIKKVIVIYYRYKDYRNMEDLQGEITKLKFKKNSIENKIIELESYMNDLKIQNKYSTFNRFEFRNEDF